MRARRGQALIYCNIIAPGEWEEGAVTCPSSLIETTSRAQGIIWGFQLPIATLAVSQRITQKEIFEFICTINYYISVQLYIINTDFKSFYSFVDQF